MPMSDLAEETQMLDKALKDMCLLELQESITKLTKLINEVDLYWPDFKYTVQRTLRGKVRIRKNAKGWKIKGWKDSYCHYNIHLCAQDCHCDKTLAAHNTPLYYHDFYLEILKKTIAIWPKMVKHVEKLIRADQATNMTRLQEAMSIPKLVPFLKPVNGE